MHRPLHGTRLLDGAAGGDRSRLPNGLRIIAEMVPLKSVADLRDRAAFHERRYPEQFVHQVVDKGADIPIGARRGVAPLLVADGIDPAVKFVERKGVHDEWIRKINLGAGLRLDAHGRSSLHADCPSTTADEPLARGHAALWPSHDQADNSFPSSARPDRRPMDLLWHAVPLSASLTGGSGRWSGVGLSACAGTMEACAASRASCTWTSMRSSLRWSSATNRHCAASRSWWGDSVRAVSFRPRATKRGHLASTPPCRPGRHGLAARMPPISFPASAPTPTRAIRSWRCFVSCRRSSSPSHWTRRLWI